MLLPAVRHQVSFWHGPERLRGDLRLPQAPGPHPVLVVIREPGQPDGDYSPWLDVVADAGFASFGWHRPADPPGCPEAPSGVGRQAREVLAAVDRLRCLPDLDPEGVALLGWGEAGRVAAQATTYSDQITGLLLACAPAGPDVGPTLSALTVPVLALFGELDPLVPLRSTVRALRSALRDGDNPDHAVAVVRGADHALRTPAPHGLGGLVGGRFRFGDWSPGLTDLIIDWLERRLLPEELPAYPPPLHAPVVRLPARPRLGMPAPLPVRQVRRRVPR